MHEPTFEAKTVQTAVQWVSPDGQRTIYEIVVERSDGKKHKIKTFSDAIATMGWKGTVQIYEKTNKRGQVEAYAKQPPKENTPSFAPENTTSKTTAEQNGKSFYYAYAKDIVVALVEIGIVKDLRDAIEMTIVGGERLYGAVSEAGSQIVAAKPLTPSQSDIDSLTNTFPELNGEEHAVDEQFDPLY